MKYIVIEIQKNDQGTISTLPYAFDTLAAAEAKYHQILSVAALTTLPAHSAVLLTERAGYLESRAYGTEA